MINAFQEGREAAKDKKNVVLDNPYICGQNKDPYKEELWDQGFIFQLEQEAYHAQQVS